MTPSTWVTADTGTQRHVSSVNHRWDQRGRCVAIWRRDNNMFMMTGDYVRSMWSVNALNFNMLREAIPWFFNLKLGQIMSDFWILNTEKPSIPSRKILQFEINCSAHLFAINIRCDLLAVFTNKTTVNNLNIRSNSILGITRFTYGFFIELWSWNFVRQIMSDFWIFNTEKTSIPSRKILQFEINRWD